MLDYAALFLLLIIVNGFFNLAEMSLVAARPARLKSMAATPPELLELILLIKKNPGSFLAAIQSGNTVTSILAGTFCVTAFAAALDAGLAERIGPLPGYLADIGLWIAVVAASYLTLVLGELLPKRIALANPEACAVLIVRPLHWAMRAMAPFIFVLRASTDALLRMLLVKAGDETHSTTEEEIRHVIANGLRSGIIHDAERDMMESILQLGVRSVRTIMTSRRALEWVDMDMPADEIRRRVAQSPCSKLIVTRGGDLDRPAGVVAKKDFLRVYLNDASMEFAAIMQPPIFVPDTSTVVGVLSRLKSARGGMLFVTDEFGTVMGIVTLTDVLEAVAGDVPEPERNKHGIRELQRQADGGYVIAGALPADDLAEYLGIRNSEAPNYKTAAGLVLHVLQRLPAQGEVLEFCGWTIRVLEVDARTILRLKLIPPGQTEPRQVEEPAGSRDR